MLYRKFADALTEVLAENAMGLARRGRLARARAVFKKEGDLSAKLEDALRSGWSNRRVEDLRILNLARIFVSRCH